MPITNFTLTDWLTQIDIQIQQLPIHPREIHRLRSTLAIMRFHYKKPNIFVLKNEFEYLLLELSRIRQKTTNSEVIEQSLHISRTIQLVYSTLFQNEHRFFPDTIHRITEKDIETSEHKTLQLGTLIANQLETRKTAYKRQRATFSGRRAEIYIQPLKDALEAKKKCQGYHIFFYSGVFSFGKCCIIDYFTFFIPTRVRPCEGVDASTKTMYTIKYYALFNGKKPRSPG
jgi:hypothetical protein